MFQNSKDFYASIEIASMVYLSSNNCLDITFFMIEDSFIWKLYVIKIEDRKNSKEKHANDVVLRVKWAREFMFTKRNKKKNPNDQSFLVIFFLVQQHFLPVRLHNETNKTENTDRNPSEPVH